MSPVDDDPQPLHATALASFTGASSRELSFQRGAELLLYRRLNEHWWEGQPASDSEGPRYLVPHLYVKLLVPSTTLITPHTPVRVLTAANTDGSTSGVDDDTAPAPINPSSSPIKPPRHLSTSSKNCNDEGQFSFLSSASAGIALTSGKFCFSTKRSSFRPSKIVEFFSISI